MIINSFNWHSIINMTNCEAYYNHAEPASSNALGGGIRTAGATASTLTISGGKFHDNWCFCSGSNTGGYGSCIYWNASAKVAGSGQTTKLVIKDNVQFYNNKSTQGGALFVESVMDLQSATIHDNEATTGGGGGIYVKTYTNDGMTTNTAWKINVSGNVSVYNNKAKTYGGGLYLLISKSASIMPDATGSSTAKFSFAMNGGQVYNNTAQHGGGVAISDGAPRYNSNSQYGNVEFLREVNINSGSVYGNHASENGGGIYVQKTLSDNTLEAGTLYCNINGGEVKENYAGYSSSSSSVQQGTGSGGAFYIKNTAALGYAQVNIEEKNSQTINIHNNKCGKNGGSVCLESGNLTYKSGTMQYNKALTNGGGFYVSGGSVTMSGGTITHNEASTNGGGFYTAGGTTTISGGEISYNTATQNGGGVYSGGGTTAVSNGSIVHNTATQNGGGIYTAGTITVENGTINENTAAAGGGVYIPAGSTLNMYGAGSICNNTITGTNGGGVYQAGTMNVAGSSITVTGNTNADDAPNNVYLPTSSNVITIVDHGTYQGVTGTTNVGISIPKITDNVGVPVIASEEPDYLWGIYYMLTDPLATSALKDDRNMYQIVYSGFYPYNDEQIFFVPTWQAGCVEDALFQDSEYEGVNPIEISTNKQLAKFMCYVNGLNGFSPHPAANGKLMADVDMDDYIWLPMGTIDISHTYEHGEPDPYTGTFDGNGYVITGLRNPGLAGYNRYGLFGETNGATVQNTFVIGCYFEPEVGGSHIGCIIGDMTGGTLAYSEGVGNLKSGAIMGGLVGVATGATIHSSMAMAELDGYTLGGLVGQTDANTTVKNCFANSAMERGLLTKPATEVAERLGGLVGINAGTVENCYVLWERSLDYQAFKFANENTGTIKDCYAPSGDKLVGIGPAAPVSYGIFHAPKAPYYYADQTGDNDIYAGTASSVGSTLTDALNAWVSTNGTQYTTWRRTMAGGSSYSSYGDINHDYPIPTFDAQGYTTVGACAATDFGIEELSHDGIVLDYFTSIDTVLTRHNTGGILNLGTEDIEGEMQYEGGTLNLYKSDEATQGTDEGVVLYIDENVSLLQSTNDAITAVTCQTMTKPGETWHLVSSSLAASPIGFTYGTTGEVAWQDDVIGGTNNPCNVSLNSSYASSLFPTDAPVGAIDLYSFDEPYYHWINLKRNSASHWHMNAHSVNIPYDEDDNLNVTGYLIPAKGYLAAIDKAVLLEASGTLNNGEVTIPVTIKAGFDNTNQGIPATEGTELKGYNLLGNPYQSYLDFATFASVNSSLWDGSATFALYDAETDTYTQGSATTSSKGSYAASGDINMHQGFFILADNAGTATFNNTMRSNTPASGTSFRGGERPAYPLINLKVTGDDGTNDVAVVEFDRPEYSSAAKMKHIGGNGKVYFRHNDEDCALLYLDEEIDNLPVRFETAEDGTYTLTWSTANATFSYLHLIDNMTGMDIDMLASEGYTFLSTTSDYASRFKLVFAYTGVEEESETATEHFAFVSNGNLIVNGTGMFEMIDMNGRTISATRLSDAQNTVALPNAAAGVYVLKLTDSASSKVQKVVIR